MPVRPFAAALAVLLAASCATSGTATTALCSTAGLRIETGFERAAAAACRISGDAVTVDIAPEKTPINPSPWYAFRVVSRTVRTLDLTLNYAGSEHRYQPVILSPEDGWRRIEAAPDLGPGQRTARFRIRVQAGSTLIAGQPLQSISEALAPFEAGAASGALKRTEFGRSTDGRPLIAYEWIPPTPRRLVVLFARQHPPETTGGRAFDRFVERLFEPGADRAGVLATTRLLFVPVVNPDGISRGNWRGNAAGADLNRDWSGFAQPEIRALRDLINARAAETPLAALFDFHSTWQSVVYAAPEDRSGRDLGEEMLDYAAPILGAGMPPVLRSHNEGAPTAKGWSLDAHGVAGLTLEFGDDVSATSLERIARVYADGLVEAIHSVNLTEAAGVPDARRFLLDGPGGDAVPVWYIRPAGTAADAPVLFVMHGVGRDADRYLREWAGHARRRGFVVITPEVSNDSFPGADAYNLGRTLDAAGRPTPRATWSYSIIESAFDAVRDREGLTAGSYVIYGHSAGAQFVHRFALFSAGPRMSSAIAANAGWYTEPDPAIAWPYGLSGAPPGIDRSKALAAPLTLLLGDADVDPDDDSLRRTPEALAQGPHRFARGLRMYASAQKSAQDMGLRLAWSCAIAPGLGHDNGVAAGFAMALVLGEAQPGAGAPCAPIPSIAP